MTKIKKYFKLAFTFLALIAMSFIFALSPVFTTYAAMSADDLEYATTAYSLFISSIQVPKGTVDLSVEGEEFRIPLLSQSFGLSSDIDGYTIRVVDPAGQYHDYVVGGTNSDDFFDLEDAKTNISEKGLKVNVQNSGKYSVVYIVKVGDNTYYSNTYAVTVKNVSYELDFTIQEGDDKGLELLLPSKMKTTTEKIELPVANVKVVGEDKIISSSIVPVVTFNGAEQSVEVVQDENDPTSALIKENDKYYLIPSKEGKYTIEYTYNYGSNRPTKTYEIDVSDDFVAPTKKDITITTPTMPTVELGDEDVTLPKLTVSDNVSNNAAYNVTKIEIKKVYDNSIIQILTNNTFTFNMTTGTSGFENVTDYKDLVGDYTVKYYIVDAYGNEKEIEVKLANVTDNTKPSVYMAYNYKLVKQEDDTYKVKTTTDADGNTVDDVDTSYAVDLKGYYGYEELTLPAIYATDKVSSYSDFKFVRYIQNTNTKTIYYLDNYKFEDGELVEVNEGDTGYNYAAPVDENDTSNPGYRNYNMAVRFEFASNTDNISDYAGEYTLGYYVYSNTVKEQDATLYSSGTTKYTFNVLSRTTVGEDSDYSTTPNTSISNIKNGSTVSTNEDLEVYISATDEGDSRLKNAVFYYYSSTSSSDFETDLYAVINDILKEDSNSDTNNYKCNLLDDPTLIEKMGEEGKGYKGFAVATQDETNATQFTIDYAGYNGDSNITIVAVSLNNYGKLGLDSRTLTIQNETEKVAPVLASIDVLSTDEEGNANYGDLVEAVTNGDDGSVSYKVKEIKDGNATFSQGYEVVLPKLSFTDDDSTLAMSVSYYIDSPESTSAGLQYRSTSGKSFGVNSVVGGKITASEVGTYYVIYTATDDAGNTTVVFFTFEVEDTSDPILKVDITGDGISKSGNTISAEVGTTITFDPTLYASDGKQVLTTTVLNLGVEGNGIKINIEDNGNDYSPAGQENAYVFNGEGSYIVTISGAYDGRTAVEKVIYVNITMPELTWDNEDEIDVAPYAKQGAEVILPDLTASQGSEVATVTVTVLDPDGHTPVNGDAVRTTRNGSSVWVFTTNDSSKGTYKITYTATTSNGSITKSFETKVGDNVAPTFTISGEDTLKQQLIYDGTDIEYQINLTRSSNTLTITVKNGDTTVYTVDTELEIWDADDSGSSRKMTSWTNLTVELSGDNVTAGDETGQYFISGTGKCTLTLTMTDSYSNTGTKTIEFNVVSESDTEKENNDALIGTILIVVSLVILAGVILFFTFTGKKGGSKNKKSKKTELAENNEVNGAEESKEDGKDDKTDDDAKTGEVE